MLVSKLKVIIADDNEDSLFILSEFIKEFPECNLVGAVSDGEKLIELVNDKVPDIVVLDINMPKVNGVEAIKLCINNHPNLKFIFVTAYEQYAVEAFSISATDYIVKPLDKGRLYDALERAKAQLINVTEINNEKQSLKRLLVRFKKSIYIVQTDQIIFIEKIGRKILIHTQNRIYETYDTLANLAHRLGVEFVLSHRSYIINLEKVDKITTSGETYLVYFHHYDKAAHLAKQKINEIQKMLIGNAK